MEEREVMSLMSESDRQSKTMSIEVGEAFPVIQTHTQHTLVTNGLPYSVSGRVEVDDASKGNRGMHDECLASNPFFVGQLPAIHLSCVLRHPAPPFLSTHHMHIQELETSLNRVVHRPLASLLVSIPSSSSSIHSSCDSHTYPLAKKRRRLVGWCTLSLSRFGLGHASRLIKYRTPHKTTDMHLARWLGLLWYRRHGWQWSSLRSGQAQPTHFASHSPFIAHIVPWPPLILTPIFPTHPPPTPSPSPPPPHPHNGSQV